MKKLVKGALACAVLMAGLVVGAAQAQTTWIFEKINDNSLPPAPAGTTMTVNRGEGTSLLQAAQNYMTNFNNNTNWWLQCGGVAQTEVFITDFRSTFTGDYEFNYYSPPFGSGVDNDGTCSTAGMNIWQVLAATKICSPGYVDDGGQGCVLDSTDLEENGEPGNCENAS